MNANIAYTRLRTLGLPVLETADVAGALRLHTSAATMLLNRLAKAGLASQLRKGQWIVGERAPDRYALAEYVTAPYPSYVSLQTALYLRGVIDQVPGVVYLTSLGRRQRIRTSIAEYSVHHIDPDLFDGFETKDDGTKLATAEKALFDIVYLSGSRSHLFAKLPELELPPRFRWARIERWTKRISAGRRRAMVAARLAAVRAEHGHRKRRRDR